MQMPTLVVLEPVPQVDGRLIRFALTRWDELAYVHRRIGAIDGDTCTEHILFPILSILGSADDL